MAVHPYDVRRSSYRYERHCECSGWGESAGCTIRSGELTPELSDKQYELIGRITIEFNRFEEVIEDMIPCFLGVHEFSMGGVVVDRLFTFAQRADLFKTILEDISDNYPELDSLVSELIPVIARARVLATRRNELVHSVVRPPSNAESFRLETKNQFRELRDDDLLALLKDISNTHLEMMSVSTSLERELVDMRKKTDSETF